MRFLVTGISGQIGSEAVRCFSELGDVTAADRGVLDLSQPATLAAKLDALAPDVIINPAAYTAVDRAEDERDLAFTVNADSPGVMAKWAAARRVPFVHLSTDYVFDGSGEQPWREDDPVAPLSVYGASKLAGEEKVRAAAGPHLIVRTSWIYAARGANFLRTISRLARERDELKIVADQIGAPTSAAFVAETLAAIARKNLVNPAFGFAAAGGTLHVAAGGQTSWHGFASAIIEGLRRRGVALAVQRLIPIPTKDYVTKAIRPLNSRLDLTRLADTFQISPKPWDALLEAELDALGRSQP
ncbi:MAG TPA: dTDP-4-dehydrorhamnose reductase [Xanthobacteraceae bacterium]|nr:dTDP-4-dehydrorhamnose reductase [Xanthobacteraceae bacterium]